MSTEVRPYAIAIDDSQLRDLRQRLQHTRWPEAEPVADWTQGAPLAAVKSLCQYWQTDYDWRRCEAQLNQYPHFVTEIDGVDIHFLHVLSPHANARPLLLTHGWPGSIIEFMAVIEPLTRPEDFGGAASDAFHLVIPSLPGYGFSGKPTTTGWGVEKIAAAWTELMKRLGHHDFFAQGGDWGAIVTNAIAQQAPPECKAVHLNMLIVPPDPATMNDLTAAEQKALQSLQFYQDWDSGYSKQQATRPQTIGYALVDSPVALAAWIYEKFYFWTDNNGSVEDVLSRDQVLDNIMLYWLNSAGASAARLYWESAHKRASSAVTVPTGISMFPKEIFGASRRWAEQQYKNIIHWNELDKGGHFAAFEQPQLFVDEMRTCFRSQR